MGLLKKQINSAVLQAAAMADATFGFDYRVYDLIIQLKVGEPKDG